jgi:hypothetical protein
MASKKIYTFMAKMPFNLSSRTKTHLLSAEKISFVDSEKRHFKFLVDDKTIYLSHTSVRSRLTYDVDEFLYFFSQESGVLYFSTTTYIKNIEEPWQLDNTEFIIDYSKIITELENIGKIATFPSTNVLDTDERKFSFIGEKEQYEVDCLGTTLCNRLTHRVLNLWNETGGSHKSFNF